MAKGKMADGKNDRRMKRDLLFTTDCFFCVKYPAKHALKLKGSRGGKGIKAFGPEGAGGRANDRHSFLQKA